MVKAKGVTWKSPSSSDEQMEVLSSNMFAYSREWGVRSGQQHLKMRVWMLSISGSMPTLWTLANTGRT